MDFQKLFADHPWLALVFGGLGPFSAGCLVWVQWWFGRKDTNKTQNLSQEQVRVNELDALQKQLSGEHQRLLENLRKEMEWTAKERDKERENADKWERFARLWYFKCHDVVNQYRMMRHNYTNERQWIIGAIRRHPELDHNSPNDPIPERPALPNRLEDIKDDGV